MPPLFSIKAITLPTKIANPIVLRIQASLRREIKRDKRASSETKNAKSFKINIPSKIPPKSEKSTFFE